MDNSPLLYLCSDISNIIHEYIKTYDKKRSLQNELTIKINRSMIKSFNIKCNELRFRDYYNKQNQFLYRSPRAGWVWTGKRMNESTHGFPIRRITLREGRVYGFGQPLKALLFPSDVKRLNDLGYFSMPILFTEL